MTGLKKWFQIGNKINQRPKDIIVGISFLFVLGVLIVSAIWAYFEFKTTPPYVDAIKYPIRGIDISAHNGEIDFKKVAASGIDFVFIKASEGEDFNDSFFLKNYENAKKAGLKIGFYHFFKFETDGIRQGVNFARTIGHRKADLGLVIDVEKSFNKDSIPPQKVIEELIAMVDYLNLLGHRITFYTNYDGYYDYIQEAFKGYPLWICRFKENPINAEWTFWQYSHSGKIDGITGPVDLDAFCGDRKEWDNFLKGALWPYTTLEE